VHYRDGLCGTSFNGYFTIPTSPPPGYPDGYYESPYDEQGFGLRPYGMVLDVNGLRPRVFHYVAVNIANDIQNWMDPEGPLIDTLHISASASYSNDGFDVSFTDPTGTAINNVALIPDPAQFSEVCSDSLGGCPLVVRDAASDFLAMDLHLSRSPSVIPVPGEDGNTPYFAVSSADWSNSDHTAAAITLDIYDDFRFASSTCDLWVQVRDAAGTSSVNGVVLNSGRGQQHAVLSIDAGPASPDREIRDVNVTCGFARSGSPVVDSTAIWSAYPY